jgi:hypothetical protein
MSKIQEKLDSLQPYVNGVRYIQGMQIVDAVFKENWTVPNSEIIGKELVDKEQNYYMFFSDKEGMTFDDLLDYVENIIKINIEREKKHELLKEKVKELQAMFKTTSLTKLNRLVFSFSDEDISPSLMEIDFDDDFNNAVDIKLEPKSVSVREQVDNVVQTNNSTTIVTSSGQSIELPPKAEVVDEQYEEYDDLPIAKKDRNCECAEHEACSICLG